MTNNRLKTAKDQKLYPFKEIPFLDSFVLTKNSLHFSGREIAALDEELSRYSNLLLDPDIEKNLISRNEFLASFAISKAEDSSLTQGEAQQIFKNAVSPEYEITAKKYKGAVTRKNYEKLEFDNILNTFRYINQQPVSLTAQSIKIVHHRLTQGLDDFANALPDFTKYHSGQWREIDNIRVGGCIPAPADQVGKLVGELVSWFNANQSVENVALFHAALYAIHPFSNGNKRVCRIFEHLLLRKLKLNQVGLYSPSYYHHKEKERYYKYLLYSLEKRNFSYFTAYLLESYALSVVGALKTGIESQRKIFLDKSGNEHFRVVYKPLIRKKEIQFKNLLKQSQRRQARQTFVSYLQKGLKEKVLLRRQKGRAVYYKLNLDLPEEKKYSAWLTFVKSRLSYFPNFLEL